MRGSSRRSSLDPSSEQREALDNLVGMLLVLLGYGAALLLAVYWALRRTLAPLQPILHAIGRYEHDDFAYRLPPLPFAEMDRIGGALNHLAATLSGAQETRRALSLKLVSSQEEERARIARELHDEVGQTLTAMRADVAWLAHRTAADAALAEVVDGVARHCEAFQLQVRDLLRRLRPQGSAMPEGVPLKQLLSDLVQSWRDRPGRRAEYSLRYALDDRALPADLALALYRLTQEALTNAARHADAVARRGARRRARRRRDRMVRRGRRHRARFGRGGASRARSCGHARARLGVRRRDRDGAGVGRAVARVIGQPRRRARRPAHPRTLSRTRRRAGVSRSQSAPAGPSRPCTWA